MDRTNTQMLRLDKRIRQSKPPTPSFVRAGLPFVMFTIGASFVVSSAIDGKNRERELITGTNVSKSERQARMDEERDQMLNKMQKSLESDFDNTKRIERPENILAKRKREREERNKWYRRFGRWITGGERA